MAKDSRYNAQDTNPYSAPSPQLDDTTFEKMWCLFQNIHRQWEMGAPPESKKVELRHFIAHRIQLDQNYLAEYANAAQVINELIQELGNAAGYEKLFTHQAATISPPTSPIAQARQWVSNEFISLALITGGFKRYGAENFRGYIATAYLQGQTPYRTAQD